MDTAQDADIDAGLDRRHRLPADVTDNGDMHTYDGWWHAIGLQMQAQIDELLCTDRLVAAVFLLRRDGGLQPRPGLYQAQDLLVERRRDLDRQGLLPPKASPPTTAQLLEKAAGITAPIVAIEALWDGDTQGWFVDLVAVVRGPGPNHDGFDEVSLTVLQHGGDIRLFNGQVPPWPEAQQATEQGQAVARHLDVPFHFTSPEAPGVDLPRWWDTQPS